MIKAIGPAPDVTWEKHILQYLNQPEIRQDNENLTVPVLEIIELDQWWFAVMQTWTDISETSSLNSVKAYARLADDLFRVSTLVLFFSLQCLTLQIRV